jgi:hypothetical protein
MATSLCGSSNFKNTGAIPCDITRGLPIMIIPGGAEFPEEEYANVATMDAAFIGKMKLDNGDSQKLYPFPVIQGNTNQTEAAKFGTLGYGLREKLVRSKPAYEFDVKAGSQLEKQLMSFDGQTIPLFIFDDKSQVWGVKNSGLDFVGAKWQIGVEPQPYGDGQNSVATKITISIIDSRDFVENAFVHVSQDLLTSNMTGLIDIQLTYISNTANVFKIGLFIPTTKLDEQLNVYDEYGADIAALDFTAWGGDNFNEEVPVTSSAIDATLKALTVTIDTAAWTALPIGGSIELRGPTVAELDAADVNGYEIIPIVLTKTA